MKRTFTSALTLSVFLVAFCQIGRLACAQDAAPQSGTNVAINGFEMYYESFGQGEPLVLLHGFNGSGKVWEKFVPELSKQYQRVLRKVKY